VNSDAAQPLATFDLQDSDYIVPKRRYNGFFQTDLELTLRELGVDTLIAFGCDTNICVLQTLAGAYFRGFKTVVPADACATFLIGTQEAGLEYFTRCYDSRVVTTEKVLGYLQ
jgi:nicotinamidase-related amidase